ncbi:dsDNA nuclease domain-containing protein [Hyphobacterium sp.]|uniref:dsDNA nuclease domain-containing protein n=1 Tax=Hyphobacterium sp. TaxID=2004662 RepID=UPI003BA8B6D9
MPSSRSAIDVVRVSRAGHTFHERWAARRALQLVFPKDNLHSIVVEGLSPIDRGSLGDEAEDVADLVLYFGPGEGFDACTHQQILQFKYKYRSDPVTASYLKKTIQKFATTLQKLLEKHSRDQVAQKLSFGFVTNADFSQELSEAISALKVGKSPDSPGARQQAKSLKDWCAEKGVEAKDLLPLVDFQTQTADLPAQDRKLRRSISDWSSEASGQAAIRLHALVELVRQKSQIEGQRDNSIRREDVLEALGCDDDDLFPADTRFIDVGSVITRACLVEVSAAVTASHCPVFLHADGGVGKTVFIQSLASHLSTRFEAVIFDCFGGGSYRSEGQSRHSAKVGLLQIVNELAARGLCDPLLPSDTDDLGVIRIARKRLQQASKTVQDQSSLEGILIVLDAADNAHLEADARHEPAFPGLLLANLSETPIEGVRLLLTARSHRMEKVIRRSNVERVKLPTFNEEETRVFLETRRNKVSDVEFSVAMSRSRGNARVLEYLVNSWDKVAAKDAPTTQIEVEHLIAQKCDQIIGELHTVGWDDEEVVRLFAALALLPPPIPLEELAAALGWELGQVRSATSDLAPMLEVLNHGVVFRDEPTETYIRENYAEEEAAQTSIADRLQSQQKSSTYAAESLPHFLVVIGDSDRSYKLAASADFPSAVNTESGKRRLRLLRLMSAFSLATRDGDVDRSLLLTMKLAQAAAATDRGDEFIRQSPELALSLGDKDTARRLFIDRAGWRGARDSRLIVAYCFLNDLHEARFHQQRAIGWINWFLRQKDELNRLNREGFDADDVAAILFLDVLEKREGRFLHRVGLWRFRFATSVVDRLVALCEAYESFTGQKALQSLLAFAKSKDCSSLALLIALLNSAHKFDHEMVRGIARRASTLAAALQEDLSGDQFDLKREAPGLVADAALVSLLKNSKQSAKRLLRLTKASRPTGYDYTERLGTNSIWTPVNYACVAAWSAGKTLGYAPLLPFEAKRGSAANAVTSREELKKYLRALTQPANRRNRGQRSPVRKERVFSDYDVEQIADGIECIRDLVRPLETAVLSKTSITSAALAEFLIAWKKWLRPNQNWNAEAGVDQVARRVGLGLASVLLRHAQMVSRTDAEELIAILTRNRFGTGERQRIFELLARRKGLEDIVGSYAAHLADEIIKDDYIEQRGDALRELSKALLAMSREEAREYYLKGLAQLDKIGSGDFDIVFSALHYASDQAGGHLSAPSAHRLLGLCHSIFQHEAHKFGWTLLGRAAANSIGLSAVYKLLRWDDQDVADFSYGLPQLVCFLAKGGQLDPRRAAVILTICEDHGLHDWRVGRGVRDLLSVARPEDRPGIFAVIYRKLRNEHSRGGWDSVWEGLSECLDEFPEAGSTALRDQLRALFERGKEMRERANRRNNSSYQEDATDAGRSAAVEKEKKLSALIQETLKRLDFTSAASIDEAILSIEAGDHFGVSRRRALLEAVTGECPYDQRLDFLKAVCRSETIDFDGGIELISDCFATWGRSTRHLMNSSKDLIGILFAHKGSRLFDLRYSGISRQVSLLSELSGDPAFTAQTLMETISRERLELSANEWLQVAACLATAAKPKSALDAFEDLLSSPAAEVGDEIGEGEFRGDYVGNEDEAEVFVDVVWHLLGDTDAYARWHTARGIEALIELGLTKDLVRLLNRFSAPPNPALKSAEQEFAFRNAQQWLLIGLARAALRHGEKLRAIKSEIEAVALESGINVIHKLNLLRTLEHIGENDGSPSIVTRLRKEVYEPLHGIVKRDDYPAHVESKVDFDFHYEFGKHEIAGLARLFGIAENEAADAVAQEVLRKWPNKKSISDFPGNTPYRHETNQRFETFREHVQRHALLDAAGSLVRARPVVRESYYEDDYDPWKDWLKEHDVSFEDGSWLADHKSDIPIEARAELLSERVDNKDSLDNADAQFEKLGLRNAPSPNGFLIYGNWTSPDGVNVYIRSALTRSHGAIKQCTKLSKASSFDFWLPTLGNDGNTDRHIRPSPFTPMIWAPEAYPIGIDDADEWASRLALWRPRLGRALTASLGLVSDHYCKSWLDSQNEEVLTNQAWGEWRPSPHGHREREQDSGTILRAELAWLNTTLSANKWGLVQTVNFSKPKSYRHYDDAPGLRADFVGLKLAEKPYRFWHAKKASDRRH